MWNLFVILCSCSMHTAPNEYLMVPDFIDFHMELKSSSLFVSPQTLHIILRKAYFYVNNSDRSVDM